MNSSGSQYALPEILRRGAAAHGGHPAVIFNEHTLTFREFNALSDNVAGWLAAHGIVKGDRVGLYCINSDFFALAYFGILKAGAVVTPINLLLNHKEISFILNDAGARALIYFDAFTPVATAMRSALSTVEFHLCIGANSANPADFTWQDSVGYAGNPPSVNWDARNDLAAILYTAGTTGHPKGAMLSHANLAANVHSAAQALQIAPGREKVLVVLPMFHAFAATAGMLLPLLNGCCIVPLPKFDPAQIAAVIAREKTTIFMAVPSMYVALLHLPDRMAAQFAPLRYCISGGAALPKAVMEQFEKKFGKLIYEGDGPTECSPVTCVNPIGGRRKPGTVGLPVPDVEMKIMDDAGREMPRDEVGEICVRGPNVMRGYWNLPEETKLSFFGDWFRTGDLGLVDADGYFSIVDRKKDMIIVNGMNVYPRMVEEALMRHPAVREAAVTGEPHQLHGEIPVAWISFNPGRTATVADIRAYCRDNLGRHEAPRKVFFMDDLPKSGAGKILKRELRRQGELERGVDSQKKYRDFA